MTQRFKTVYDVARHLQNEHHLDEWDIGCFIKSMNNVIEPMVAQQTASWMQMDIDVQRYSQGNNHYCISINSRENVHIAISGNTLTIAPKNRDLFA